MPPTHHVKLPASILALKPPALLLSLLLCFSALCAQASTVGDKLRWPVLTTLKGQTIEPDTLQGRYVFMQIWASWCPYCSLQNASLPTLQTRWEKKGGIFITVSIDKDENALRAYLTRKSYGFPTILMPTELKTQLGRIKSVPTVLVIGPDGSILRKIEGQMFEEDLFELAERLPTPSGGAH